MSALVCLPCACAACRRQRPSICCAPPALGPSRCGMEGEGCWLRECAVGVTTHRVSVRRDNHSDHNPSTPFLLFYSRIAQLSTGILGVGALVDIYEPAVNMELHHIYMHVLALLPTIVSTRAPSVRTLVSMAARIEVEKKFAPPDMDTLSERIASLGGTTIGEKSFTDVYYDTADCALTRRDMWLRCRDDEWELKLRVDICLNPPYVEHEPDYMVTSRACLLCSCGAQTQAGDGASTPERRREYRLPRGRGRSGRLRVSSIALAATWSQRC